MDTIERNTCPVCGYQNANVLMDGRVVGLIFGPQIAGVGRSLVGEDEPELFAKADMETVMLECKACRHVWPRVYPTQIELDKLYRSNVAWGAFQQEVSSSYRYQFGRARNAAKFLRWHIPAINAALDVGCGKGALMHRLHKAYHCAVYGVEPGPEAAIASTIGPVALSLDNIQEGVADLITVVQVLEHVVEPKPFLLEAMKFLHPLGSIYIEVPNQRPVIGTAWHAHYFNQLSLRSTLYDVGLFERAYWETPWPSPFSPPRNFPRSIGILCQKWETWDAAARAKGKDPIASAARYDEAHGGDRAMPWDRKE